jgi:hypothetical protein
MDVEGRSARRVPKMAWSAAAGFPSPAEDYIDRPLDFNELLIEHPAATFAIRIAAVRSSLPLLIVVTIFKILALKFSKIAGCCRLGGEAWRRYVHEMCGRARLSSDVSEIKLVFSIPPDRPTPATDRPEVTKRLRKRANTGPAGSMARDAPLTDLARGMGAQEMRSQPLDIVRWLSHDGSEQYRNLKLARLLRSRKPNEARLNDGSQSRNRRSSAAQRTCTEMARRSDDPTGHDDQRGYRASLRTRRTVAAPRSSLGSNRSAP